ncbi:MAG: 2,3-bisphosphoglycerate-independent phosphoglycerate mutase, partial [Cyanobacteria bacterium NC_groundwater_1444_Ag_S-0.65um_54_12]|nr:2,3-bisphosphoglycerate-independent phosphoglycerate mutase [Cyanobacteria bacterium NC_groundwater_1444_Ag_S-0.65um_54_12]
MERRPVVLAILDGFGSNPDPQAPGDAVRLARKPTWDRLIASYPHSQIPTSGMVVGLPPGQQGNSEVGHLNMGAGRVVYQEYTRISKAIHDGDFFDNAILREAMRHARVSNTSLHLLGLVSDGGVHSHIEHLVALLKLARAEGVPAVWIHAFTDGRDTSPTSGAGYLATVEQATRELGIGRIATVSGRYYAMDRDKRWERTSKAWAALALGKTDYQAISGQQAAEMAYLRGETDEFITPTLIDSGGLIKDGASVIFFNFRPDRARQLTHALALESFAEFERLANPRIYFTCFTQYDATFQLPVAFERQSLERVLSPVVADAGLRQLRCAETEKYAHVTFFFNGGVEKPYPGEERILLPSPKVATYDLKPEMSAPAVAATVVDWILQRRADLIVLN